MSHELPDVTSGHSRPVGIARATTRGDGIWDAHGHAGTPRRMARPLAVVMLLGLAKESVRLSLIGGSDRPHWPQRPHLLERLARADQGRPARVNECGRQRDTPGLQQRREYGKLV